MFRNQSTNATTTSCIQHAEQDIPPRIIGVGHSIWLNNGEATDIGYEPPARKRHHVVVHREGEHFYLTQHLVTKRSSEEHYDGNILLNGFPVHERVQLKDGDFILFGKAPAIFQVDPQGDKKKHDKTPKEHEKSIVFPGYLQKAIAIDTSGIVFHKQHVHIRWKDIEYIQIECVSYRTRFSVSTTLRSENFQFILKNKDKTLLVNQLAACVPINLSVTLPSALLQDGYQAVAWYKVITPAEQGRRTLPASQDTILGVPDQETLYHVRLRYIGLLIILVIIAMIDIKWVASIILMSFFGWLVKRLFPFSN